MTFFNNLLVSSPRAWGCFRSLAIFDEFRQVFPTSVGVFLVDWTASDVFTCLPHERGGVSIRRQNDQYKGWSSPRAWGCFRFPNRRRACLTVFPTSVGVFLRVQFQLILSLRLPHERGGVSLVNCERGLLVQSSPRAWGCF